MREEAAQEDSALFVRRRGLGFAAPSESVDQRERVLALVEVVAESLLFGVLPCLSAAGRNIHGESGATHIGRSKIDVVVPDLKQPAEQRHEMRQSCHVRLGGRV